MGVIEAESHMASTASNVLQWLIKLDSFVTDKDLHHMLKQLTTIHSLLLRESSISLEFILCLFLRYHEPLPHSKQTRFDSDPLWLEKVEPDPRPVCMKVYHCNPLPLGYSFLTHFFGAFCHFRDLRQ